MNDSLRTAAFHLAQAEVERLNATCPVHKPMTVDFVRVARFEAMLEDSVRQLEQMLHG